MIFAIRKAEPNELNVALELLYKAAIWLRNKDIDYWQNWLEPPDTHIAWIKQGFDNGEFHFAFNNEKQIVGMYRLQYTDEDFWGQRNDKAGYIHSFTTNREFSGNEIGYNILKEIENELLNKGFEYLRLDCSPDILGLCQYYESYGFKPRDIVTAHNEKLRLYEKKIH